MHHERRAVWEGSTINWQESKWKTNKKCCEMTQPVTCTGLWMWIWGSNGYVYWFNECESGAAMVTCTGLWMWIWGSQWLPVLVYECESEVAMITCTGLWMWIWGSNGWRIRPRMVVKNCNTCCFIPGGHWMKQRERKWTSKYMSKVVQVFSRHNIDFTHWM